jgi:hypothetical protein
MTNPRAVFEKLIRDNPDSTEDELLRAFTEMVEGDEDLPDPIVEDLLAEFGVDGMKELLQRKEQRH